MQRSRFIDVIYTHSCGGPLCIIHSGITYPVGGDIVARRRFLEANYDGLRRSLMREPRGYKDMFGVFLTPPSQPDSHGGVVWICGAGWLNGCGHGTIGLTSAMVATGMVSAAGNIATVRLETTAGMIAAEVATTKDTVEYSRFENVPAFLYEKDVALEFPEYGAMKADIAFGGNFFAIIEWDHPRLALGPESGSAFQRLGQLAKEQLAKKVRIRHPLHAHIADNIDLVSFYSHRTTRPDAFLRNIHFYGDRQIARSPGGTSLSALMAMFEARGRIKIGQEIAVEGILGPEAGYFYGKVLRESKIADRRAIIPQVKGRANIVGYAKWLLDPEDPVSEGFEIL